MNLQPLLALLRKHESRGDYNAVWGGIRSQHRPKKPLTSMTIREVLAWQDSIDRLYMSEAAGAYQILEDTLRGLYTKAGLTLDHKFDVAAQDKMAQQLLVGRGLIQYLEGKISTDTFCNNIAKEWASMPVVTQTTRGTRPIQPGQSYYAGDGLNKAHASVADLRSAVMACRERVEPTLPPRVQIQPAPVPPKPQIGLFNKGGAAPVLHDRISSSGFMAPQTLMDKLMLPTAISAEVGRIVRHSLTPIVAAAVAGGWLPAAAQGPIIEVAMIMAAFGVSIGWSKVTRR